MIMKCSLKKTAVAAATMAAMLAAGSLSVGAASNYSYLTGQQRSSYRNSLYEQAQSFATEEEKKAFLNKYGIAEEEWSEENAASYSYVTGQQRGSSFKSDDSLPDAAENQSYNFQTGKLRGSSYAR